MDWNQDPNIKLNTSELSDSHVQCQTAVTEMMTMGMILIVGDACEETLCHEMWTFDIS